MIPRILDMLFLSAPHLAGDDVRQRSEERRRYRFYPRHPRGWRPHSWRVLGGSFRVSIHATLAGGDECGLSDSVIGALFLSTPPSRVATSAVSVSIARADVSIHATLAGGDGCCSDRGGDMVCFYPRHPRGWRPAIGATLGYAVIVSIHATLAGGDASASTVSAGEVSFLSTPPSRVATILVQPQRTHFHCFYPRHPRGWRHSVFSQIGRAHV